METSSADPSDSGDRVIDATYSLLDRQLVDPNGRLAGKVDDLELTDPTFDANGAGPAPAVVAILSGPAALGPRLGGRLGKTVAGIWRRLHPDEDPRPTRIPFEEVARLSDHVELGLSWQALHQHHTEWLSTKLISRLPGANREAQ